MVDSFGWRYEDILTKSKEKNYIISFQPISDTLVPKSIHQISMKSKWIDVIGTFWRATSRKLYGIVWIDPDYLRAVLEEKSNKIRGALVLVKFCKIA